MKNQSQPLVYKISIFLPNQYFRRFCGYVAVGSDNVPAAGGCILASNHVSVLDPMLVGCGILKRYLRFMARNTLFRSAFQRWWALSVGTVFIDRDKGDIAALKVALKILKAGGLLSMFPEGTRSKDGKLQTPKAGIGFLIAKSRVPVVPVYIDETFPADVKPLDFLKKQSVKVYYGVPIMPQEIAEYCAAKDYAKIAGLVMSRIGALQQEHGRAEKACAEM